MLTDVGDPLRLARAPDPAGQSVSGLEGAGLGRRPQLCELIEIPMPDGRRDKPQWIAALGQVGVAGWPARQLADRIQTELQDLVQRLGFGGHARNVVKQLRLTHLPFQEVLVAPALGDVADETQEQRGAFDLDGRDREFDGKGLAGSADRRDLDAAPQERAFPGREEPVEARAMGVPVGLRNDEFGEDPPNRVVPAPAENRLGLMVPVDDHAVHAHDDDAVQCGLEHQGQDRGIVRAWGRRGRSQLHDASSSRRTPMRRCSTGRPPRRMRDLGRRQPRGLVDILPCATPWSA